MIGEAILVVLIFSVVALLIHWYLKGTIDKNRDDTIDTP